jgi:hypothetical protein
MWVLDTVRWCDSAPSDTRASAGASVDRSVIILNSNKIFSRINSRSQSSNLLWDALDITLFLDYTLCLHSPESMYPGRNHICLHSTTLSIYLYKHPHYYAALSLT